jgi:acetyl-CoA carboxylase biotin carboxyl carrier protein
MFTVDEIKEIIQMVDQSSIERFEIEQEATKLVIVKSDAKPVREASCAPAAVVPKVASSEQVAAKMSQTPQAESLYKITAPLVGTFYSTAEPGADPFVKIGQQVSCDTVVCVLESMKLFSEVEAGIAGEIVEIMVKDGEFVEYGQPLFIVRPE